MKNKYISSMAIIVALGFSAQTQILNPGFENWTNQNPNNWTTSNITAVGVTPVTETTDKHGGTKALHGQVVTFTGNSFAPIVQSGNGGTGFPISQQYASLNLFYKFMPLSGDRFAVNVEFKKNGNVIGQGAVALTNTVNSYTALSVPVNYTSSQTPDTVIVQIMIVGPNGSDFHMGSEMFVDDLLFSNTSSVEAVFNSVSPENAFPNPASESVSLFIPENQHGTIDVYDLTGLKVKTITVDATKENHYQLDVSDLPSGSYLYTFNRQKLNAKAKFVVQH